jgi:hypothetical protein
LWVPVDEGVLWRATRSPEERAAKSVAGAAMAPVAAMAAVTMDVKETILNCGLLESEWSCEVIDRGEQPEDGRLRLTL